MKKVFKKTLFDGYRRGTNLADVLIHGKLNKMLKKEGRDKAMPCGEERYNIRSHVGTSGTFYKIDGERYKTQKSGDCNTKNVVYMLSCKVCDRSVYLGETEGAMKQRVKEHPWAIHGKRDKVVALHFNKGVHSAEDLQVQIIEGVKDISMCYRKTRKEFWMNKFDTLNPFGLNVKLK